jgi:antagonist of KipI
MTLEVTSPGLATSVQDRGRPNWTHLGVPPSGACDPWSLAVANLLVGNDAGAAAVEMTLVGPRLVVQRATRMGLAGADLGGIVAGSGRRLEPGRVHALRAGEAIDFPGNPEPGARAYLALPGGIDVPIVLDSRSTCLAAAFGGLDGRYLAAGDILHASLADPSEAATSEPTATWPATARLDRRLDEPIRIVAGSSLGVEALLAASWRVGTASDRVGLRLDGEPLPDGLGGETVTHGVSWGAIQAPANGQPIVLLADHQTTGGYRVIAVVAAVDRPRLGQLRPGAAVAFEAITIEAAVAARREQDAALVAGAAALRESSAWDALTRSAGG